MLRLCEANKELNNIPKCLTIAVPKNYAHAFRKSAVPCSIHDWDR